MIHLEFKLALNPLDESQAYLLSYYREIRDMSREDLSAATGIPAGEIQNYECKKQELYYEQAKCFADVLNIDVSLLLDEYTMFTAPGYGKRIREIRAKTGLPQAGFAELIGSRRHTVSIWEIEYHRPSRKNYAALMAVAGGTP